MYAAILFLALQSSPRTTWGPAPAGPDVIGCGVGTEHFYTTHQKCDAYLRKWEEKQKAAEAEEAKPCPKNQEHELVTGTCVETAVSLVRKAISECYARNTPIRCIDFQQRIQMSYQTCEMEKGAAGSVYLSKHAGMTPEFIYRMMGYGSAYPISGSYDLPKIIRNAFSISPTVTASEFMRKTYQTCLRDAGLNYGTR